MFTIYETLFQNAIKILPTICQYKSKMPGKIGSACFINKKWEIYASYLSIFFDGTV